MRLMPERLRDRAQAAPDATAYTFLDDGEREGARMTWGELDRRASALAQAIAASAAPGARALILCPPGLGFIPAFFAALRARAIAVSAYPPRTGREIDPQDRTLARLRAIARDAAPAVILAPGVLVQRATAVTALVPELAGAAWIDIDVDGIAGADVRDAPIDPNAAAFLQVHLRLHG